MMPVYRVIALRYGRLVVDKSTLTYGRDFGKEIEIPVVGVAIEGNGHRILVDTGFADIAWVNERVCRCYQDTEERLQDILDELGWRPESIDIVINTHLHYDHCGNNALFTSAGGGSCGPAARSAPPSRPCCGAAPCGGTCLLHTTYDFY